MRGERGSILSDTGLHWVAGRAKGTIAKAALLSANYIRKGETLFNLNLIDVLSGQRCSSEELEGLYNFTHATKECGGLGLLTNRRSLLQTEGNTRSNLVLDGIFSPRRDLHNPNWAHEPETLEWPETMDLRQLVVIEEDAVDASLTKSRGEISNMLEAIINPGDAEITDWDRTFRLPSAAIALLPAYMLPLLEWYGKDRLRKGFSRQRTDVDVVQAALELLALQE